MNQFGRTAAAVIVAAGLFGYIYFVESKKDPKTDESGSGLTRREKVFTGLDKLKVKSLTLKKRNGEVVQAEKNAEAWMLTSPQEVTADASEIGMLLDALQNLETEEVVNENATDLGPFGLTEPKVSVSLTADGAAKPFEFDLGDSVPAGSGIFARVPGKPRLFTVSSTLENTLSKSAFDLRDRGVVKVKKDAIRAFEVFEKNKPAYRLARGGEGEDDWKVVSPVATRAARWSADSLLGLIENLRMESIATEEAKPSDLTKYGLGGAARRVVLGLEGDKTLTLEVGKKTDDGKYYAREAASKLVAVIPTAVADDLDKGLRNLRATRLLDVATYEVTSLEVAASGTTRTFTKSTTKGKDGIDQIAWKSVAPVKDATEEAATSAMIAIGGAEVSDFIDAPKALPAYGLDAPALRVTLRFDGGKKEDWFELSVKDDAGFARRRDDVAVLKLDKAKTEGLIKAFTALGS
ncbi:MAG TPA: DUF4340 domain-containing protein [Vicinamibacteria bacterium]|nr:DUF4340 domain-containing protein [Vicinamibacteria bacterium]HRB11383.1 DUF4340 domain-containing protein [Vicinamibacteria bacterium]